VSGTGGARKTHLWWDHEEKTTGKKREGSQFFGKKGEAISWGYDQGAGRVIHSIPAEMEKRKKKKTPMEKLDGRGRRSTCSKEEVLTDGRRVTDLEGDEKKVKRSFRKTGRRKHATGRRKGEDGLEPIRKE